MADYVSAIHGAKASVSPYKIALSQESDFTLKHRRRLKITRDIKAGDALKYGDNYGCFRSRFVDPHADNCLNWEKYQGRTVNRDMAVGEGLFINDLEPK